MNACVNVLFEKFKNKKKLAAMYTLNSKERIKHSIKERYTLREHSFFLSVEKLKNTQKTTLLDNTRV